MAIRYVSDAEDAGYRRRRRGQGFSYLDAAGRCVDAATRAHIAALVIPPAWTEVWICADPNGHIQATGLDARGRKQYIYHPDWVMQRDRAKFERMAAFGAALPAIRRRVARDLARPTLDRRRVLALAVRLLDRTLIRVGNDAYARDNGTFGLTTLRDRHARAGRSGLVLEFPGKNGLPHRIAVDDRRLARLVRACQDLPGQRLFQYLDADGGRRELTSADVNDYLREIGGGDFTAKDFRTWAATVQAACRLCAIGCPGSQTAARRNVAGAVREVSQALRNTAAVCRKSYIHPAVLEEYAAGALDLAADRPANPRGLDADERAVLAWLRRRDRAGPAAAAA